MAKSIGVLMVMVGVLSVAAADVSATMSEKADGAEGLDIREAKAVSGDELYPGIRRIELPEARDLFKKNEAVFIDARNAYEYDTIRIKGAVNIPVNDEKFANIVRELRAKDARPFVFYCNGVTCMKSFLAAQKARSTGERNVSVYPYGILSWAKTHSEDVVLHDKEVDLSQIITEEDYAARKISPERFTALREELKDRAMVLDIRTVEEVGGVRLWPTQQYNVQQSNDEIRKYIHKAKAEGRTLLIYDENGHQIRWVQYLMRAEGFKDYYFMDGGFVNYMRMIDEEGRFVMTEYVREKALAERARAKTYRERVD